MAHISGTISNAAAGKLLIQLSGTFGQDNYRDAGFPGESGGIANILLRAYVGPSGGTLFKTEPIDRYAPVSQLEVDYPGGSVTWIVGTEQVAAQSPTSGIWRYSMSNLKLVLTLRKK